MDRQLREGKFGEDEGLRERQDLEKQERGAEAFTVLSKHLMTHMENNIIFPYWIKRECTRLEANVPGFSCPEITKQALISQPPRDSVVLSPGQFCPSKHSQQCLEMSVIITSMAVRKWGLLALKEKPRMLLNTL